MTDGHMLQSLTGASRFQAVMATRPCARSVHFMVHHLAAAGLSTGAQAASVEAVDDSPRPVALRLGMVVPKRHARRSVTRSLVKREMRSGVGKVSAVLPSGDWIVRLRAPFDPKRYLSARSEALAHDVRAELAQLISDALRQTTSVRRPAASPASTAPMSGA